jgi:hypothetical protein
MWSCAVVNFTMISLGEFVKIVTETLRVCPLQTLLLPMRLQTMKAWEGFDFRRVVNFGRVTKGTIAGHISLQGKKKVQFLTVSEKLFSV